MVNSTHHKAELTCVIRDPQHVLSVCKQHAFVNMLHPAGQESACIRMSSGGLTAGILHCLVQHQVEQLVITLQHALHCTAHEQTLSSSPAP